MVGDVLRHACPSLCPVTGQPDFAILVIDYVPDRWLVESKSLKLYPVELGLLRRARLGDGLPELPGMVGDVLRHACPIDPDYCARFTAPEFTSLCPVTGQPDFAILVIDYVPDPGWRSRAGRSPGRAR
jgi:NADPH-dependent 7-cyano-7-deazaguanine reductase QueF